MAQYRLVRVVRSGKKFHNGVFPVFADAVKAMENGQQFHRANGTSSKFRIEDAESGEEVKEAPPVLPDYDEAPATQEEDPEYRILQLEEELERLKAKMKEVEA